MSEPREVKIMPVLNGWMVQVGCQTLAFNNIHDLTIELTRYLLDPDAAEEHYRENAINKVLLNGPTRLRLHDMLTQRMKAIQDHMSRRNALPIVGSQQSRRLQVEEQFRFEPALRSDQKSPYSVAAHLGQHTCMQGGRVSSTIYCIDFGYAPADEIVKYEVQGETNASNEE